MEIRVEPQRVAIAFLWVATVLTIINSVLLFFYFYLGDDDLFGLVDYFDFDIEGNIPTLYSAVAVLFCSALLALITYTNWHKPNGRRLHWLGLTVLFFFLALDEGTAIHEQIGSMLENYMDARGALYFLWVLPYGIATFVLMLAYLRFVWELPKDTRVRFVAAAVIFLTGALAVEMLGAREADLHGYTTVTYSLLYSIEEMLEMFGIIMFIYALLMHLTQDSGRFCLVLERSENKSQEALADIS